MKKLTSVFGLLAVAAGLTAAVAMAPAPTAKTSVNLKAGELFWINADGSDGGFQTPEDKQIECGTPVTHCANGYDHPDPQPTDPVNASLDGTLN